MQPRTAYSHREPGTRPSDAQRGDETELYRRHHRILLRAVSQAVRASPELIEDACQTAWTILLERQPDRISVFGWLYVVAVRETYRLAAIEHRDAHLEDLPAAVVWESLIAERATLEDRLGAHDALRALASLPAGQRRDLALLIAGFSYREIAAMTGGRTYTNVSKHLTKARARVRLQNLRQMGAKPARQRSS